MLQNVVYWSFTLQDVDDGNFSLRPDATKDLGDTATAKDFFNQFIDDENNNNNILLLILRFTPEIIEGDCNFKSQVIIST